MDGNLASHPSVTRRVGRDVDETIGLLLSSRLEGLLPVHIAASSCSTKTRKDNNDPRSRPGNPFVYRSTSFGSRRPGKSQQKRMDQNAFQLVDEKYVGPDPSSSSFFLFLSFFPKFSQREEKIHPLRWATTKNKQKILPAGSILKDLFYLHYGRP